MAVVVLVPSDGVGAVWLFVVDARGSAGSGTVVSTVMLLFPPPWLCRSPGSGTLASVTITLVRRCCLLVGGDFFFAVEAGLVGGLALRAVEFFLFSLSLFTIVDELGRREEGDRSVNHHRVCCN